MNEKLTSKIERLLLIIIIIVVSISLFVMRSDSSQYVIYDSSKIPGEPGYYRLVPGADPLWFLPELFASLSLIVLVLMLAHNISYEDA